MIVTECNMVMQYRPTRTDFVGTVSVECRRGAQAAIITVHGGGYCLQYSPTPSLPKFAGPFKVEFKIRLFVSLSLSMTVSLCLSFGLALLMTRLILLIRPYIYNLSPLSNSLSPSLPFCVIQNFIRLRKNFRKFVYKYFRLIILAVKDVLVQDIFKQVQMLCSLQTVRPSFCQGILHLMRPCAHQ